MRTSANDDEMQIVALFVVYVLGIALSAKSIIVLGGRAPWTSAGWWLTIVYFIAASVKATIVSGLPTTVEYAALVALAVAFVVAGVRDEPQADPWWWPTRLGPTRAQKRETPSSP